MGRCMDRMRTWQGRVWQIPLEQFQPLSSYCDTRQGCRKKQVIWKRRFAECWMPGTTPPIWPGPETAILLAPPKWDYWLNRHLWKFLTGGLPSTLSRDEIFIQ